MSKIFCPNCEAMRHVFYIDEENWEEYDLEYEGGIYHVRAEFYQCQECGEEFEWDRTIQVIWIG